MNQHQVRELPAKQEPPQSFWRRLYTSKKVKIGLSFFIILMSGVVYITAYYTERSTQPPAAQPVKIIYTPDEVVSQVLVDENTNGWDEQHQNVLINWRRDDHSKINCSDDHCDVRGLSTRHDILNDLRDLENLYWYRARHVGDTSMDGYIKRLLPVVKKEWGQTTQAKGWLYFTIQRMGIYSGEPDYWKTTLENWAEAQYQATDPVLGVHHGLTNTVAGHGNIPLQDGYRVDGDLELGLALVDAGTRFHHPEWITTGKREVDVVIQQAYSTKYHLFNRVYLLHDPQYGSNQVYDYQARMGENGQEIEELLRTGLYTKTDAYVQLAKDMIEALAASPLRDHVHGGFYYRFLMGDFKGLKEGYVDKLFKETRQFHMIPALHLANSVFNNRWSMLETELVQMATSARRMFLPAPVPGFTYELKPDGSLYPCATCAPSKNENWVTSEADNIAIEGLQAIQEDKSMPTINQ